jgi:hypothetical protein
MAGGRSRTRGQWTVDSGQWTVDTPIRSVRAEEQSRHDDLNEHTAGSKNGRRTRFLTARGKVARFVHVEMLARHHTTHVELAHTANVFPVNRHEDLRPLLHSMWHLPPVQWASGLV